jgi:fructose-1-phosphate kinase PfkB-like protein
MGAGAKSGGAFMAVCLNPVIQSTLAFARVEKGEVNRTGEHRVDASGKGVNVARVLGQLGREAWQLTQLGGPTRDWFLSMCVADGVRVRWAESGSEIRFCTTVIDSSDGSATELVEEARPVAPGTAEAVLAEFDRALPECGAVLLSGTKAAGFPDSIMPEMASRSARAGKRLYLDLKGPDLLACLPFSPAAIKPNLEELLATWAPSRARGLREEANEAAMRELVSEIGRECRDRYGSWLVVTRGAKSTLFWDGAALRERHPRPIKAVNPIGSGDSFHAGLAAALEGGATIAEAVAEGGRLGELNAERLKPGSIL